MRWSKEMDQSGPPASGAEIVPSEEEYNIIVRARIERFNRAFEEFLHAGISLGQAHATLLKEREFLASLDSAKLEPMLESVDRKWLALLGKIGGSG